jgi:CDP-paratose 2-epimerase
LVTGGAGFIGTNVADRLASQGERVVIFDNLARPGVAANLAWLRERHGHLVQVEIGDVRDADRLRPLVARAGHVFHFAAQVAVTTSLEDPIEDFEINARGTLNLLEAIRDSDPAPGLLFTSTNKVYGALDDLPLEEVGARYVPRDPAVRDAGVDETRPLDFYSPYGCSKGCADQYVLDHARTYGLRAAVFRMSCIYGPHQCGNEDQGWVAHFLLSAIAGAPITIFGDGYQVRDALFVDDLVDAMLIARRSLALSPKELGGQAFNIGGGPENAVSLLGLLDRIALCTGHRPRIVYGPWRPGDQRYYVSYVGRFSRLTGWAPSTRVTDGLRRLYRAFTASRTDAVAQRPSFGSSLQGEAGTP